MERKAQQTGLPIHYVDLVRMELCLGKPGAQWKRWSGQQRACYLSHRSIYRRIVAEVQAGRAVIVPRASYPSVSPAARLLDQSDDIS